MPRIALLLLTLVAIVPAAPAAPEEAKPEDLVLVQKGTLPIIVSAPHGGRKAIPGVTMRAGTGVTNFFSNIEDVWIAANNLLQGKPENALQDVMRASMRENRQRIDEIVDSLKPLSRFSNPPATHLPAKLPATLTCWPRKSPSRFRSSAVGRRKPTRIVSSYGRLSSVS